MNISKNQVVPILKHSATYLPYMAYMFLFVFLAATNVYASGVPFLDGIETKITEVTEQLKGPIATSIITLVIVIFGLGSLTGRINKVFGFGVCGGAIIITFASDIATWVIGT